MVISLVKQFRSSETGSFAIITAVSALALVAAGAVAVDVTRVIQYRTLLSDAADNAVLSAVSEGSRARKYAYSLSGDGDLPPGVEDIESLFRVNFLDMPTNDLEFVSLVPQAKREGTKILAGLAYEAKLKTFFGGILGVEKVTLSGSTGAAWAAPAATDYYLLLDNTASMGLGATSSDVATMVSNLGCQFACHVAPTSQRPEGNNYAAVRQLGVTLRYDVVKEASQNLTDTADQLRFFQDQYRMAVYDFGPTGAEQGLTELQPLTSDLQAVRQSLEDYQLMSYEDTYTDRQTHFRIFDELNQQIPEPSAGADTRQRVVFFVSDGVHNAFPLNMVTGAGCRYILPWPLRQKHCVAPIDPFLCKQLKDRGIKVAVLYTVYQPIVTTGTNVWDQWMHQWAGPAATNGVDHIARDMKACASDNLYFAVGPDEGISEAMEELFRRTLTKPALLPSGI